MFGFVQERYFVITMERVYNIKKNKIKRQININKLSGISKALLGKDTEFTIHVLSEYDYRFHSEKREDIIAILKQRFLDLNRANLPIFGINKNNLRDFTTTEKDMKKQSSRYPPDEYRIKEEDLLEEDQSTIGEQPQTWQASDDNYNENLELRSKQFAATKDFSTPNDEDNDDEEQYAQQEERATISKGGGDMIFNRKKDNVKLQDFVIKKMIGKGTFGKVFLVENTKDNNIYAMKCIRKDIIIDNEQFDNIKLEKEILFNVDHPFIVNMEYVFQNEFRIYFLMKFIK